MNKEPTDLEFARAVAIYLGEELKNNPAEHIPVHRDIAAVAVGLAKAVAESLARHARTID